MIFASSTPADAAAKTAVLPAGGEVKLPRIFRRAAEADAKSPAAKSEPKAEVKARRAPPRPRPIRSGHSSWRPILFKLLIGVGVASAAVALQDKIPRFESRGSGVISATVKGAPIETAAFVRPLAELKGHVGAVTAVHYSDDGRSILTAGEDARLRVWDASSGALERTIELDNGPATAVALRGTHALTGHATGEIVLWDIERAEKISTFKRNDAEVWSLVFAGRDDRFAASGHDWKVALWDTANTATPIQVIDAHDSAAQAVAFAETPDGPRLASGGADKLVKLWNLETLDQVRTYRGHRDFITSLAFSPSGKTLASSGLDGSIRVWSTSSSRLVRRLYGHRGRVGAMAFSPTGDELVSAGADGQVRIWDVSRGRTARTILGGSGAVKAVDFSPDGARIASAGDDGVVRLWANPVFNAATN
jgi:WD40 repeat protein